VRVDRLQAIERAVPRLLGAPARGWGTQEAAGARSRRRRRRRLCCAALLRLVLCCACKRRVGREARARVCGGASGWARSTPLWRGAEAWGGRGFEGDCCEAKWREEREGGALSFPLLLFSFSSRARACVQSTCNNKSSRSPTPDGYILEQSSLCARATQQQAIRLLRRVEFRHHPPGRPLKKRMSNHPTTTPTCPDTPSRGGAGGPAASGARSS
jgi:hypothetical protein